MRILHGLLTCTLLIGGLLVFSRAVPAAEREGPKVPLALENMVVTDREFPRKVNVQNEKAAARVKASELYGDEFAPPPWGGMRVQLEVLVDGRPVRTISHMGKMYLPVPRLGCEYAIRVWNHGPRRIAALVSVDGLSVINGRPASEADPGYLVAPRSHIVIKGWRRNLETVAAFSFEEREKSYAYLVGRPENVGVIGLIAIEEMSQPRPLLEKEAADSARTMCRDVGRTGTGYGRDLDSPVYYVPFVRSANKRAITIYYDTVAALRKAGVPVDGPIPFPGDFVPPPPGDPRK